MKPIDIMMLLDQESEYVTESGCRIWMGQTWSKGYGKVKDKRVHRLVWEAVHGPIPPGLLVCHICDVTPCANVEHFFLGTHKDNMADRNEKGRCNPSKGESNVSCKLTDVDILEIRSLYFKHGVTQYQLADAFEVCQRTISLVTQFKTRPDLV